MRDALERKEALVAVEDEVAQPVHRPGRLQQQKDERGEQHQGEDPYTALRAQRSISSPSYAAETFAAFFRGADLVIFDAMYALAEAISIKADWGHSSNIVGVELCQMARAKHLMLFHHEPANNDATLEGLLKEARRFEELTRGDQPLKVSAAYDGLEVDL